MSFEISEVIKACARLKADGKPITIARVKSRLVKPLPLTFIVQGIQKFNSASSYEEIKQLSSESNQIDLNATKVAPSRWEIQDMQKQILKLQEEVKALQAEVSVLKSK